MKRFVCASAGWRIQQKDRQPHERDKPASLAKRRAEKDQATHARCVAAGVKETVVAQLKMRLGVNALAARNAVTRDGSACVGELIDRVFKLLGRVGVILLSAFQMMYA